MLPEDILQELERASGQDPRVPIEHFDSNWKAKNKELHRPRSATIAKRFIDLYGEALAPYLASCRLSELVDLVSAYREHNDETKRIIVDMWLMARFPPQSIQGVIHGG